MSFDLSNMDLPEGHGGGGVSTHISWLYLFSALRPGGGGGAGPGGGGTPIR